MNKREEAAKLLAKRHYLLEPTITEIPFPSVIVEVTPEEYQKVKRKLLKLPDGWSLGPALPKPDQQDGQR